jgi:hypothetical protein
MPRAKRAHRPDWYSTPDERRHRIETYWTMPRDVIEAVRARATDGRSPSEVAEDAIRDSLGLPPRARD